MLTILIMTIKIIINNNSNSNSEFFCYILFIMLRNFCDNYHQYAKDCANYFVFFSQPK